MIVPASFALWGVFAVALSVVWAFVKAVEIAYERGLEDGFIGGARYVGKSPGYPSKPSPDWYGWDEINRLRGD